ncbi:hypothetical protein MICRO11B_100029 [Micrococcus luteus]|nr:hypothetical protein MICRO11B_100029 [Micrococcus luteus]
MGLFWQVGGVGTSILRERPTRLISAGASWQEPHDPQQLVLHSSVGQSLHHTQGDIGFGPALDGQEPGRPANRAGGDEVDVPGAAERHRVAEGARVGRESSVSTMSSRVGASEALSKAELAVSLVWTPGP